MLPVPTNGQTAYLVSISFRKAQGDKLRTKIKANGLDGFIEAISKQSYLFRSNVLVQTTVNVKGSPHIGLLSIDLLALADHHPLD